MRFTKRPLLLASMLLAGWAGVARADTFAAGSIVIPMDECFQYNGSSQPNRLGWNGNATLNALSSATYPQSSYASSTACIGPNTATLSGSNTNPSPYFPTCWGNGFTPSTTGLQHAFGLLYYLASNNIPVSIALNSSKEALGDYDFSITSPDGTTNPFLAIGWSAQFTGLSGSCLSGSAPCYQKAATEPSMSGATVYYRGAPFIIDSAYASQALTLLSSSSAPSFLHDVVLHVSRNNFTAPISGVIQTTPKPVGIVSYSNSNGVNIAKKYLDDAGITTVMTSLSLQAYSIISLKVGGSGSVSSLSFTYPTGTSNSTLVSSAGSRILDLIWAPDINLTVCQNVTPNPNCFDSTGLCQTTISTPASSGTGGCGGVAAWCCTTAGSGELASQYSFTGADGNTYYCPCGIAGVTGSSYTCAIDNYQFNGTQCVTANTTGDSLGSSTGCTSSQACDAKAQHCLTTCTNNAGCGTGYSCEKVYDVAFAGGTTQCSGSNKCPGDYTCEASSKSCYIQVCVPNSYVSTCGASCTPASGTPAVANFASSDAAACGSTCTSGFYCDSTTTPTCTGGVATCPNSDYTATCDGGGGATISCGSGSPTCTTGKPACGICKPTWGCSSNCSSCPASQKNANVWSSLKTTNSTWKGLDQFLAAGGRLLGTDNTALTAEEDVTTRWLSTSGFTGSTGALSGTTTNNFCAAGGDTSATSSANPMDSLGLYPSSNIDLQIGDFQYKQLGGNSPAYQPKTTFISGVDALAFKNGSSWVFPAVVGQPVGTTGLPCTSAAGCGTVIYEGANNYGSSQNSAPMVKVGGQHIIFDTLLNSSGNGAGTTNPATSIELSRSTPVQGPSVTTSTADVGGQIYIGSFDWGYTSDSSGTGNKAYMPPAVCDAPRCPTSGGTPVCGSGTGANSYAPTCSSGAAVCSGTTPSCGGTNPSPTCNGTPSAASTCKRGVPYLYPYATGHFREIKNNSDFSFSGATSLAGLGDCTASGTACSWDTAYKIQHQGQARKLYAPTYASGAWTLTEINTANATAIATAAGVTNPGTNGSAFVNLIRQSSSSTNNTGKVFLGAVDFSTPAVIQEANTVVTIPSTATTRPTIAYFGARDGFIHAVCVHDKGTTGSNCFTNWAPGEEIFAVMPPSILTAMGTQYNKGTTSADYSQINVGGTMRVADVKENFGSGTRSWKTILLYGTRKGGGGAVGALEVSYPDPGSGLNAKTSGDAAGLNFLWESTGQSGITGDNVITYMGPTLGATIAQPGFVAVAIVTAGDSAGAGIDTYMLNLATGASAASDRYTWTIKEPGKGITVTSDVPPLATVVDSDGDYQDDMVLVASADGSLRKMGISETISASTLTFSLSNSSISSPTTILNSVSAYNTASGGGVTACANSVDCQPMSTSPALYYDGTNRYAIVATGGVSWADQTENASTYQIHYKMYAQSLSPASTSIPVHTWDFKTIASPLSSMNGVDGTLPLRAFAQPSIVGTDIFVNLSNIAVDEDTPRQITLPYQHPGLYWGLAARFAGSTSASLPSTSTSCASFETCVYASGSNYTGATSLLYTESGTTGSTTKTVTLVGGGVVNRQTISGTGAEVNSVASTAISLYPVQTRTFKVLGWFGID